nr:MAG TPA: hypothetical protein [Caudoviricetes sp.]
MFFYLVILPLFRFEQGYFFSRILDFFNASFIT